MARSKVFKSKAKPVNEELPSDDEIDAFNKQKDFVSLDAAQESDSDDVEDEGLYDLSDDVDGTSEDEYDSDDSDAEGGTLGRRNGLAPLSLLTFDCRSWIHHLYMCTYCARLWYFLQSSELKRQCAISSVFSKGRKETRRMMKWMSLPKTNNGARAKEVTTAQTQRITRYLSFWLKRQKAAVKSSLQFAQMQSGCCNLGSLA